jgi:hypothetical protein
VQGQSGEASEAGGSAAGEEEGGKKTGLLEAIRLPLVSVFPRSKLKSTKVTYPATRLPFAKIMKVLTPDLFLQSGALRSSPASVLAAASVVT